VIHKRDHKANQALERKIVFSGFEKIVTEQPSKHLSQLVPSELASTGLSLNLHEGDHFASDACEARNILHRSLPALDVSKLMLCAFEQVPSASFLEGPVQIENAGITYKIIWDQSLSSLTSSSFELCEGHNSLGKFEVTADQSQVLIRSQSRSSKDDSNHRSTIVVKYDGSQIAGTITANSLHAKGNETSIFARSVSLSNPVQFFSASFRGYDDLGRDSATQFAGALDKQLKKGIIRAYNESFRYAGRNYIDERGITLEEAEDRAVVDLQDGGRLDPKATWFVRIPNAQDRRSYPSSTRCGQAASESASYTLAANSCGNVAPDLKQMNCVQELFQSSHSDSGFVPTSATTDYQDLNFPNF
jgi:hypothetical protein